MSIVLCVQTAFLLAWHLSDKGPGSYKNIKTWILFLLFTFECLVAIRYTFNLYNKEIYPVLLTLGLCLQFIIFYLLLFHFTTKASNLLNNHERAITYLKVLGVFYFVCFLAILIWQITTISHYDTDTECKSFTFTATNILGLLTSIIFLYFGWVVTKNLKIIIKDLKERGKAVDGRTALNNMWLIIILMLLINTY
jgi:hypothetical protein